MLANYVGRYRINDENAVEIALEDGRLRYTETTATGRVIRETTLYASSETEFYFTDIPVTLTFQRPAEPDSPAEPAPGLTLHLPDGQSFPARRIE